MNWSFSKLMIYEACPLRFKLQFIDKLPQPPLPPSNPLERGTRIHENLEHYVKGLAPLQNEARAIETFKPALDHLGELFTVDKATGEDDWIFDSDWESIAKSDWDRHWLWAKLDFNAIDMDNAVTVVGDYKSGKSAYKQMEHVQQLQLYAAITALRQEWADTIITELWYVDEGHIRAFTYTRDQALMYVGRFEKRADRIFADKLYRPNPNKSSCRYCPYSPRGTGACPVGVM